MLYLLINILKGTQQGHKTMSSVNKWMKIGKMSITNPITMCSCTIRCFQWIYKTAELFEIKYFNFML